MKLLPLLVTMVWVVSNQVVSPAWSEYADVVLNKKAEAEGMRPVIYPHWFHRIRYQCKVCHFELGFEMQVGSNKASMADIMDGKFCGVCHNGILAWNVDLCDRCHTGYKGMQTGIRNVSP